MNTEIAGKLLALRKQKGYSQEELAEKLGVSRQAVSKWERGEASPDTENLISIARLYSISLDRLFNLSVEDSEERSVINLEKKIEHEQSARIKYPENSASEEIYLQKEVQKMKSDVQYKEPEENYSKYFRYETVDDRPEENTDKYNDTENINSSNIFNDFAVRLRTDDKFYKNLIRFPYPLFASAAFMLFGALFNLWHPMWMAFLTIPLYYTAINAVRKNNANIFCYPVLVVMMFLTLGFTLNLWHPAWFLFLTIPAYYWAVNMSRDEPEKNN